MNTIKYYNSVNDLKHDTTIKPNMVLKTLGYYNKNDGGNATYLVRELAESDIEDSATLFLCNNLDRLKPIILSKILLDS